MSKYIDIEYCGSWGYGGPANRLKAAIAKSYPDVEIKCHSANGATSVIEVNVVVNGTKHQIWRKGKADTENGHAAIVAAIKPLLWSIEDKKKVQSMNEKELLKIWSFFKTVDW